MIINNNIPALNTYRQMGVNQSAAQKAMEKLSSGLRINRAGDDAAGLAISEKMRAQIRGLTQASRNSQDGISLIQTAEGALQEAQNILQRMRVLATQAANDTNVSVDRGEIQKEINQLSSEINRIGNTTEFNTRRLLNGDLSDAYVVSEAVTTDPVTIDVTKAITQTIVVGDEAVSWSDDDSQVDFDISFSGTAANGFDWADLNTGATNELTITRSGNGFTLDFEGTDASGNTLEIDAEALAYDHNTGIYSFDNHGIKFSFTAEEVANWADTETVTIDLSTIGSNVTTSPVNSIPKAQELTTTTNPGDTEAALTNFQVDGDSDELLENVAQVDINWDGTDLVVDLQDKDGNSISTTTLSWDGGAITYESNGITFDLVANDSTALSGTFKLEVSEQTVTIPGEVTSPAVVEDRSAKFQIGANQNQSMSVSIGDMRSQALGVTNTEAGKVWVEISRPYENLIEAGTMKTGQQLIDDGVAGDFDANKYYIEATFTATKDVTDGTNAEGAEYALSMEDHASAAAALTVINDAIERVSAQRSQLGAYQNRLEHTIANLDNSAENLQAAESRIRDVDMAREIMEMTRANILAQASQAMLAQANMAPQSVLQLLG